MQQLSIRPVDTFFFRNHKPFSMGENSSATGIFPPRLGTVYGGLRSAYIHCHSDFTSFAAGTESMVKEWMGTRTEYGKFRIKGVFVERQGQLMLPLPADYQVVVSQQEDKQVELAYPLELVQDAEAELTSDQNPWKLMGVKDEKSASAANGFLPLDLWKHTILRTIQQKLPVERPASWLVREPKVGITRDNQLKIAQEGMLYQLELLRFADTNLAEPTSLAVLCDQMPDFSQVKLMQLGGENRPWAICQKGHREEFFSDTEKAAVIAAIEKQGKARIILLTPGVWKYGHRPDCWRQEDDRLVIAPGLEVKLLTVAMDRPQVIGGWDIAGNRPKVRKYAVAAGTVLYVQVETGQAKELVEAVAKLSLTDELSQEGYGWAVCGTC